GRLIADPERSLPYLKKRMQVVPPADADRLARLIADLDSDAFATRDAASRDLTHLGADAEPALRAARAKVTSREARARIERLLEALRQEPEKLSPEELAHVRAIQVLERIGTKEARELLKRLAEGAAGSPRTRDAREALQRLERAAPAGVPNPVR